MIDTIIDETKTILEDFVMMKKLSDDKDYSYTEENERFFYVSQNSKFALIKWTVFNVECKEDHILVELFNYIDRETSLKILSLENVKMEIKELPVIGISNPCAEIFVQPLENSNRNEDRLFKISDVSQLRKLLNIIYDLI